MDLCWSQFTHSFLVWYFEKNVITSSDFINSLHKVLNHSLNPQNKFSCFKKMKQVFYPYVINKFVTMHQYHGLEDAFDITWSLFYLNMLLLDCILDIFYKFKVNHISKMFHWNILIFLNRKVSIRSKREKYKWRYKILKIQNVIWSYFLLIIKSVERLRPKFQ